MAGPSQNTNIPSYQYQHEEGEFLSTEESEFTSHRREVKTRGSDMLTKHFRVIRNDITGEERDVCNYCGTSYKHSGGYGNLSNHMTRKHPDKLGIDKTQTQIGKFTSSSSSSQLFKYSDANFKDELAKFIAMEHLAFSFGEKVTFTNFMHKAVNPAACRFPRNTCKRKIMELFGKGKIYLNNLFETFKGRVSICSDIWSDHWQSHSYMGVTCHWIDESWIIQKRIIAFRVFDDSHTAHNIYLMISNILQEYGLLHKVLTIGFDNASANTASITDLKSICQPNVGGKFFHIRCACHVLNLCVQDGLKSLTSNISPIKEALNLIWTYSKIRRNWINFCKINGIRPKKFSRDVPTRWNSTYFLLNQSFEYKDLLCDFISQYHHDIHLYPSHWDICSKILNILKVFNDATNNLSGVYYPTSNIFMIECLNVCGTLYESENDENMDNTDLLECIGLMRQKWLNYYQNIPLLYLVATVLDPRFKTEGLEQALQNYYHFLNISSINISSIMVEVKNTLIELFDEYVRLYGIHPAGETSHSSVTTEPSRLPAGNRWLMQRSKKSRPTTSSNFEIDKYLTTPFEFSTESFVGDHFQILDWWHRHQGLFPVLSVIAKEILAAPVSTVAVEQAFSSGGNILEERRSTLHPSTLEAQTCLDDWSRAELRQQEHEPDSFEDLCDNTDTGTEGSRTTGPPSPEDEEE